ncbi:hypothetical protein EMPG_15654 [Blastomyces silverae]|uniref:SprT-like domain-containing protein n=1 Tax=Blastomyces silverae TaxID=2060906 RepID=A0A0H1BC48_9EURO|nr:hypothetical protein EMPG_15654 [Blastomyces silverae]
MARLSRVPPKGVVVVVDIREDSDVEDTDTSSNYEQNRKKKNASRTHRAGRGGIMGALKSVSAAATNANATTGAGAGARATATATRAKQNPQPVTRSPTKTRIDANNKHTAATGSTGSSSDDDHDDRDTPSPPRATAQTPRSSTHHSQRQRQRRQLGPRHTNSLLMPFPAAIGRYDDLTPGRGLGDVENAPLPEQLEEYKYGAGERRGDSGGSSGSAREVEEVTVTATMAGKHEWREQGGVESESDEEEGEEEEDEEETDEFDSLDDFIVGDDEDLSYFDESSLIGSDADGDEEEEEEYVAKPRSSPRKLFKGLRSTPASITPRALFRDKRAAAGGGNNTDPTPAGVGGGGRDVNSDLPVNDVKAGSNRSTPHSLFDDSSDDSEDDSDEQREVIPSLPKKFDLKPPASLTGSKKSSSPKKNRGIDHRALGGSMEGSQPSSSSRSGESENRTVGIVTPPSSPSKPRLYSPSKSKNRIPPTPHRPSIDAFWSQDIINEWNDQYSPRKMNTPRRGLERFHIYSENEDGDQRSMSNRSSTSPQSSPSKSPIKGSPSKKAVAAAAAAAKKAFAAQKKEFDEKKVQMAEEFFKALDVAVTGGEIQKLAAAAGGVKIIWSKTLNTTAGRANWKRETVRQKPSSVPVQLHQSQTQSKQQATSSLLSSAAGYHEDKISTTTTTTTTGSSKSTPTGASSSTSTGSKNNTIPLTPSLLAPIRHHASIELASKVIDSEDRLLNTLAHEYCHLANFMISNVRNHPHGASFKQWAARCERALAAHPVYGCAEGGTGTGAGTGTKPKIRITTKHSYVIHYKYLWCCVQCGHEYGRHSRSIDVKKSRCGRCKVGELAQVRPKPRGVKGKVVTGDVKGMGVGAVEGVTKSMGGVHLDMW